MKTGKITSNGQSLYWESHGEGIPLVLVMGIGYDSTLWASHQVPFFSEHFQTIIFDNRDAGRSSSSQGPSLIADMADDIAGLLDGLGIDQAHFTEAVSLEELAGNEFTSVQPVVAQLHAAGDQLIHLLRDVPLAVQRFSLTHFSLPGP